MIRIIVWCNVKCVFLKVPEGKNKRNVWTCVRRKCNAFTFLFRIFLNEFRSVWFFFNRWTTIWKIIFVTIWKKYFSVISIKFSRLFFFNFSIFQFFIFPSHFFWIVWAYFDFLSRSVCVRFFRFWSWEFFTVRMTIFKETNFVFHVFFSWAYFKFSWQFHSIFPNVFQLNQKYSEFLTIVHWHFLFRNSFVSQLFHILDGTCVKLFDKFIQKKFDDYYIFICVFHADCVADRKGCDATWFDRIED